MGVVFFDRFGDAGFQGMFLAGDLVERSKSWIEQSWQPRTASRYTGDGYGYGWFLRELGGQQVRYAWGYGGQMLYVVPVLDLVVAMTSNDTRSSARSGPRDDLHGLRPGGATWCRR